MADQAVNIVWLKRDLRTQDHAALEAAERDSIERGRQARKKIWRHRKNAIVKAERDRILQTQTRNNNSPQA